MLELRRKIKNNVVTITDLEDEDKIIILVENNITHYGRIIAITHSQFEDEFDELITTTKQVMKELDEK